MNELKLPEGWNYKESLESLITVMPKDLPPYQGMVLIVSSQGECSVHGTIMAYGLYTIETRLWRRYGTRNVDWVLFTDPHTNYWENKHRIRETFMTFPVRDGFFVVKDSADAIAKLPELSFLDESQKKAERAENFAEQFSAYYCTGKTYQSVLDELYDLRRFANKAMSVFTQLESHLNSQREIIWLYRENLELRERLENDEMVLEALGVIEEFDVTEYPEDRIAHVRALMEKTREAGCGKGGAV